MTKNEILQNGKFTQKFIAVRLYPQLGEKSAMAKFANKLNGTKKRKLTEAEISCIKEILK